MSIVFSPQDVEVLSNGALVVSLGANVTTGLYECAVAVGNSDSITVVAKYLLQESIGKCTIPIVSWVSLHVSISCHWILVLECTQSSSALTG